MSKLMDERPGRIGSNERSPFIDNALSTIRNLDWVREADVRFREEGPLISGEVFVVPANYNNPQEKKAQISHLLKKMNWRSYNIVISLDDRI